MICLGEQAFFALLCYFDSRDGLLHILDTIYYYYACYLLLSLCPSSGNFS